MNELLSLTEYTKIANKILKNYYKSYGKKYIKMDEDGAICDIVHTLIKSDETYDPNHYKATSLETWRYINCLRILWRIAEQTEIYYNFKDLYKSELKIKHKTHHTSKDFYDPKYELKFIMNNANLTSIQKQHIDFLLQGKSRKQIAMETGKTVENIRIIIKKAIKKMQRVVR